MMGLFDAIRNELIDIVEWVDDSQHTLVWRFPRHKNEIKNGAQLIVRPGQIALFVNQGKIADVFEPGQYSLETKNLPVLSTLMGWKYGFNSPFKAEVYFVSTRQVTDLKWGTPNPIMLRDADFGPIRLRAFGTYAIKATNAKTLIQELVGTDGEFETDEVGELLRSLICTSFAQLIGESKIAALDLAGNYATLSETLRKRVLEKIDDEYGLDLPQLLIVNVSLPPEVEKAMDTRSSMGVIGNMQAYQQYQMGQAVLASAQNPAGGLGATGAGLGLGLAMANQMGQMTAQTPQHVGPAMGMPPPPPPPVAPAWHVSVNGQTQGPYSVEQLASMIAQGQLSATTMVWTAGMAAWSAAASVPQLAGYFPPPPPA